MIVRVLRLLVAAGFLLALAALAWRWLTGPAPPAAPRREARPTADASPPAPPRPPVACLTAPGFAAAAAANRASLSSAAWAAFGRPETGWAIYAPLAAREIGSTCAPDDGGFAKALATWQRGHGLAASGIMDEVTLKALDLVWLRRRPFVAATAHGACPPPPEPGALALATPAEVYGGETIQLRADALAAYRRMLAAARAELPQARQDRQLLTIFSGYRDPAGDAARCAAAGDCGSVARANCSAHRTGLAVDLNLGAAPGSRIDSSDDANRLYQSRTAAYRWLVANADRFGFVNYPFEPWHWEWRGP